MRHASMAPSGVRVAAVAAATLLCVCPANAAEWRIVSLNGSDTVDAPFLRFSEGGVFTGSTGCNRFNGSVRYDDGDLVIVGPVATTRMACVGDRLTVQEDGILALLAGRITVDFDPLNDSLILRKDKARIGLVPNREESAPQLPEPHAGRDAPIGDPPYVNLFGRADDLAIRSEPDPEAAVIGGAYSGQVLRSAGCEGGWCRVETLDGGVSGWGEWQYLEASNSALRAGQGVFDAVGRVPCAVGVGAPMTPCAMGVAREGGGSATVVVAMPGGFERVLFFTDGTFAGPDRSQAGGGFESAASREGDLFLIRVDDERYEIPEAVVFGG